MVTAPFTPQRTRLEELAVKCVAVLKPPRAHPRRRAHGVGGLLRKRDVERAIFAAEKSRRRERLQLLPFPEVETLPDVNERRHRRIERAAGARDPRAEVRCRHRLRRHVARVPVELVPRVQDKPEVRRLHPAHERPAVHHRREIFKARRKPDAINRRGNRGKRAQHFIRIEAGRVRGVALRVEGLGVRHTAAHPEDDHAVRRRRDFLQYLFGEQRARRTRSERSQRGRRGRFQKIPSRTECGVGPAEIMLRGESVEVHGGGTLVCEREKQRGVAIQLNVISLDQLELGQHRQRPQ